MYSCIVVDDELNAREAFEAVINTHLSDKLEIKCLCASVKEAVEAIYRYQPDIVFLDVEMPKENGFKLFDYFEKYTFEVIFITAYRKYAVDAIRYAALDYILKPVNYIDLQEAIFRYEKKQSQLSRQERIATLMANLASTSPNFNKIAIPTSTGYQMVNMHQIVYCEGEINYTKVHLDDGNIVLSSKTLKIFEDLLPDRLFFRIHKSHLVNLNHIRSYNKIEGHSVVMSNGIILDVASRRLEDFLKSLTNRNNG